MIIDRRVARAADVRDHIVDTLRRELIGPAPGYPFVQLNGEEVLRPQDPPRYRYSCGILFPRGVTYSGSLDAREEASEIEEADPVTAEDGGEVESIDGGDDPSGEGPAGETETEVDPSSMFLPSTMGVSFLADVSGGLGISANWGTYRKEEVPGYPQYRRDGKVPELWFRQPGSAVVEVSRDDLDGGIKVRRFRKLISSREDAGQLLIDIVSRSWSAGLRLVTVTMINATASTKPINEHCFFQCGFSVTPKNSSRFLPYPDRPLAIQDAEERSLALLYRDRPNFAVGHGCGADWSTRDGLVQAIRTEVLPSFEQFPIVPRESLQGVELSMKVLSEADRPDLLAACQALASAYRNWIKDREAELSSDSSVSDELRETGEEHLRKCWECHRRIEDGIALLDDDAEVREAFQGMNYVMLQQREHYRLSSEDVERRAWLKGETGAKPERPFVRPAYPPTTKWRPFQLAFILMNLRSFSDPGSADRSVVDIIWFPTGGGKTEAYLGPAAFAILLRRLRTPENGGTTILMRYTLRLLTTQQFQRAASLICALELMRRSNTARLGLIPISIGLWLGGAVTPNRRLQAIQAFERLAREGGDNPFIVLACPWCGVDMGPREYGNGTRLFGYRRERLKGLPERVRFCCEDPSCDFSSDEGLPLEVVDDEIYEQPPTLLIGTVDKFAMMPWEPEARKIFGIDNPAAGSPPDLIIQDELHLISGPLGSMVGHYETVVDEFCTNRNRGVRTPPKVIASTATISRADEQVLAVYGRKSLLFPPQGLSAADSFFAEERPGVSGRTYVGVLATALPSHVTAQVRTLAALLQAPALTTGDDEAVDGYWTLIVYFNSLRELGRASTLVQADIREYLNSVWDRIGLTEGLLPGRAKQGRRFINNFRELTSRLRSTDIPAILQQLFTPRPSNETIDLCYATNMIQVGLDVPRLSLMSIVGQPKTASEYIQASSRVGRDLSKPGLVVTNYNPFKPRDRSHFESFRAFHESAYRHVEPTSVTPFSIPVCERAIHALAVAIARFWFPELRNSPSRGVDAGRQSEIRQVILERIRAVDFQELGRATAALDRFLDDWNRVKPQQYGSMDGSSTDPLIWPAGRPLPPSLAYREGFVRPTASSMRNVDAECEATPITVYSSEGTV
jgi:hypothetical protein